MFPMVTKTRSRAKLVNLQVLFKDRVTSSDCAKLLSSLMEYMLIQFQQLPGSPRTFYFKDTNVPSSEDQISSVFSSEICRRKELHKLLNDFDTLKQSLQKEIEDGNVTEFELHVGNGPPFTDYLLHVSLPSLSEEMDNAQFISKHMAVLFKTICECEDLQKVVDDVIRPSNVDIFFAKHSHVSRNFYPVKHYVDCASKSHINIEFLVHPQMPTSSCNRPECVLSEKTQDQQVSWYRLQRIRGFGMDHLYSHHFGIDK